MWKVRNYNKHKEQTKYKWTMTEIKDILWNLRKTKATERHNAEEIITWRKRKIDSWAKRRLKDIERKTAQTDDSDDGQEAKRQTEVSERKGIG